jgi:microcin C transport system substrate-binding protein
MKMCLPPLGLLCLLSLLINTGTGALAATDPAHGTYAMSIYGHPKYPANFNHFDYVDPDAPKGGRLRLDAIGTFDTLNPWTMKGTSADGLSRTYDTLTVASLDEPFTQYGLLAERMDLAPDRSWEIFYLNPNARFSDNTPVTAEDVVYTFHLLITKGSPFWAFYYKDVTNVKAIGKLAVKFTFKKGASRELPLIIGQMAILPKHYWEKHDFTKTTLTPPIGSGPYKVAEVNPGKRIVYQRRKDYWGKDLPVNRGLYNFDTISYDYYMDDTVALEAFKGGAYDFRNEMSAQRWATGYTGPALASGTIIKQTFPDLQPAGMQAFAFNLRNPLFDNRTLRHAISLAFDFQWTNKALFYGQYKRTRSYFQNSEMAAIGLPSRAELALLDPYRDKLPKEVFTQVYEPPVTDGHGRPRKNLRKAQQLLQQAGYQLKSNQLYTPDGKPVAFEFLLSSPAFERVVLPFTENLAALGIKVTPRRVDQPQYINRVRHFDYDMIVATFPESASPGSEQRIYWTSAAAKRPGSQNYIGIASPVVDALVDKLVNSHTHQELVTRCRALDRVLQWGYYVVPNWYNDHFRIAYRNTLAYPATSEKLYALPINAWWSKETGH